MSSSQRPAIVSPSSPERAREALVELGSGSAPDPPGSPSTKAHPVDPADTTSIGIHVGVGPPPMSSAPMTARVGKGECSIHAVGTPSALEGPRPRDAAQRTRPRSTETKRARSPRASAFSLELASSQSPTRTLRRPSRAFWVRPVVLHGHCVPPGSPAQRITPRTAHRDETHRDLYNRAASASRSHALQRSSMRAKRQIASAPATTSATNKRDDEVAERVQVHAGRGVPDAAG